MVHKLLNHYQLNSDHLRLKILFFIGVDQTNDPNLSDFFIATLLIKLII